MTVLPQSPDRNLLPGTGPAITPPARPPLLTQRAAVIFTPALAAGTAVGLLAAVGPAQAASAVVAGGAACGGVLTLLNRLIG